MGDNIAVDPNDTSSKDMYYGACYHEGNIIKCFVDNNDVILWFGDNEKGMVKFKHEYFGDFLERDGGVLAIDNKYSGEINAAVNMLIYRYELLHNKKGNEIITVCGSYTLTTKTHLAKIQRTLGIDDGGVFGIETFNAMKQDFQIYGEYQ